MVVEWPSNRSCNHPTAVASSNHFAIQCNDGAFMRRVYTAKEIAAICLFYLGMKTIMHRTHRKTTHSVQAYRTLYNTTYDSRLTAIFQDNPSNNNNNNKP